jgi:PAS domain S-box-containing protein
MRLSELAARLRDLVDSQASVTAAEELQRRALRAETDLLAAEYAVQETRRRYRAFFVNNADALWQVDIDEPIPLDLPLDEIVDRFYRSARLSDCNDVYARLKGAANATQLVGAAIDDLMPRRDPQRFAQMRQILDAGLRGERVELSDHVPDGTETDRIVTATPIIENGCLVQLYGISCDITRLRKTELALRESERSYRTVFDSAQDALFLIREEIVVECNPKSEELFGRPRDQIVGRTPYALSPPRQPDGRDSKDAARDYLARAIAGTPQFFEWRHSKGNSAPFDAEVGLNPVPLANGGLILATVRDITERKQRERELRELKARLENENIQLREVIHVGQEPQALMGESEAMRRVLNDIRTVGPTNATVLILGETGVGKELVARALHQVSQLEDRPLVTVNCAALTGTLIESEFFGHERGAFTGAVARKRGRFELADGGTIFLDEVGDLPLDLQAKLLRVLQYGEFERVGGTETLKVNVRVIAATNRDLEAAVRSGTFRADLYYRLNVFPIEVPPLRKRRSDIPLLIQHCLSKLSRNLGKPLTAVTPRSLDQLMEHDWPGNVRELFHVLERAAIRTRGTVVEVEEVLGAPRQSPEPAVPSPRLEDVERLHILAMLRETNWVIEGPQGAASRVGLHPNTLRYRMRKLGIERPQRV